MPSAFDMGSDDLSGSEAGGSLSPAVAKKKPQSTAVPARGSRGKGGTGAKTAVAPARRAGGAAATPVVPVADDDSGDESSSSPSSSMGNEIALAVQGMLQKHAASKKKAAEKEAKKLQQAREDSYSQHVEKMQQCIERHAAKFAKEAQAAEKMIGVKRKAVEKEQAQFFADVQKLEQEIEQTHKQTQANQRKVASSIEDFKHGATRIVKGHETQCATVVKEAKRRAIAEVDKPLPFDDVLKAIARVTSALQKTIPTSAAAG